MQAVLGIVGLLTTLGLLWSRRTPLGFGSYATTLLSAIEVLGIVVSVVSLGWLGLALFAATNLVAVVAWSCVLALRVEENLRPAVTESGESMEDVKALAKRIRRAPGLASVEAIEQSALIRLLAERGRSLGEIESIAPEIGKLHLLHRASIPWLVERFDRLLRLTDEPAANADEVAATVSASARVGAVPFTEMLDAMITFYSGEPPISGEI